MAALLMARCAALAGVASESPPLLIDAAVGAAVSAGASRVIIELRIVPPFKPEVDLPDAAALAAQRQAIAKAQSNLLSRLAGTKFSVSHHHDGLPFMAMEVDDEALGRLKAWGDLVTRVQADERRFPQP